MFHVSRSRLCALIRPTAYALRNQRQRLIDRTIDSTRLSTAVHLHTVCGQLLTALFALFALRALFSTTELTTRAWLKDTLTTVPLTGGEKCINLLKACPHWQLCSVCCYFRQQIVARNGNFVAENGNKLFPETATNCCRKRQQLLPFSATICCQCGQALTCRLKRV